MYFFVKMRKQFFVVAKMQKQLCIFCCCQNAKTVMFFVCQNAKIIILFFQKAKTIMYVLSTNPVRHKPFSKTL